MRMPVSCVDMPRKSRGTMLIGERSAIVARAPCSARSSAISARVAGADHQHALVHEPIRVAVLARVHKRAAETLLSGHAFGMRDAVEPGRDHHRPRPVGGARALHDKSVVRGIHAAHGLSRVRHNAEAGRVGVEFAITSARVGERATAFANGTPGRCDCCLTVWRRSRS